MGKIYSLFCLVMYFIQIQCDLLSLYKCSADIVIGGLFPIATRRNASNKQEKCSDGDISPYGLQEALAMVYAVHNINEANKLVPNCTIGVDIANSCDTNEHAIKKCLQFDFVHAAMKDEGFGFSPFYISTKSNTIAVVGLRKSTISNSVATMLNLFHIPTVSYGSTDRKLSDKERFPTFSRTIPTDKLLAEAITALIRKLKWNIVYVIYDRTDYGVAGFSSFEKFIEIANSKTKIKSDKICIARTFSVSDITDNPRKFEKTLQKESRIRGFILFLHKEKATELLFNVFDLNMSSYTWILSEGIDLTYKLKKMFSTAQTKNIIIALQPAGHDFQQQSPILQDYLQFVEKYTNNGDLYNLIPFLKDCMDKKCFLLRQWSYFLPYVIDTVYVVAHTLHNMGICCGALCSAKHKFSSFHRLQMDMILNVTFKSALNYLFEFDENGDVKGQYDILLLKENANPKLQLAGTWDSKKPENITLKTFAGAYTLLDLNMSVSTCDVTCGEGMGKEANGKYPECCSKCVECKMDEYADSKLSRTCEPCPKFYTTAPNKTSCVALKENTIQYNDVVGIVMATCAVSGQIVVVFVMLVFFIYRHTHIIRASSWDISLTMLAGTFLCFSSPYIIIGYINDMSCKVNLIGSGLSLSLLIGALFVKTNRIYRIFGKNVLRKGMPKFLGRGWQFGIVLMITAFDMLLSITVAFYPSDPVRYERTCSSTENITYAVCYYSKSAAGVWWMFHCILVFICTYQAVLTRKVPGNYNEARNIMLAMMAITLEMLFVLPSFYYGTIGFYRRLTLAIINLVSASSTLFFMFLPKIYIIFFRPSENKEHLPHGTLGSFASFRHDGPTETKRPKLEEENDGDSIMSKATITSQLNKEIAVISNTRL